MTGLQLIKAPLPPPKQMGQLYQLDHHQVLTSSTWSPPSACTPSTLLSSLHPSPKKSELILEALISNFCVSPNDLNSLGPEFSFESQNLSSYALLKLLVSVKVSPKYDNLTIHQKGSSQKVPGPSTQESLHLSVSASRSVLG